MVRHKVDFGTPNSSIISEYLDLINIVFFIGFSDLPISVYPELNQWNTYMRYDPSRYLIFILGFYQRSVLFFFYRLQFNWYLKNFPIGNTVSWCSGAVFGCCMYYIHYSIEWIFMAHVDEETKVQSENIQETGVGVTWTMRPLKRDDKCPYDRP